MSSKNNMTIQYITKYLLEEYKINVSDGRPLLEIVIDKFKNKKIIRENGIYVFK